MTPCRNGCASLDLEWCSECGAKLPALAAPPAPRPEPARPRVGCPRCGTERTARFCETCCHDFERTGTGTGTGTGTETETGADRLEAVVTVDASGGEPVRFADRVPVIPLEGPELLVGRHSVVKEVNPEIALDDDAAVSHRHAKLRREADGRWTIVDLGSSNGTELNGALLAPGARTPVGAGDEIRVGRHTVIRIRER